ncbi:hypothetical protein Tco_0424918 [Tanacetum coccineum]
MPYPRFTKVIFNHFISKDKTISMRNMINLYTVLDDTLLVIKDSKAYKTYLGFATGKATPKKARKFKKVASPSKVDRCKCMDLLSDVALLEVAQLKKTLKKSKLETHKLHASGLGDGVGSQPNVPDEQEDKTTSTDEGTVTKDDDDVVDSDANGHKEASDSEKTDSDEDENPNLNQNNDEEELKETEHEEVGKGDEEMTDKTEVPLQNSSISSDFSNQFLNLDNVLPTDTEVVSMMNVKTAARSTIPSTIPPITPLQQQSTPTPTLAPTTATTLSQLKQADYFAQLLKIIKSQISAMVDAQLSTRLEDSIKKAFRSYIAEFEKKAKDERNRYIYLVEKSVKEIIKDEVTSQLPQILPKEVSDYATPVTQSTITESLENIILAKSSSQPKSTYEAAVSLTAFELKKILLEKIQKSKSYRGAQEHKDLYDALVKSYKLDKDLFESYAKVYSLKRDKEDKDKDEDPPARSDQGLKKRKTSKDVELSRGYKLKESKSSSSKGSKSQPKSSVKSAQAEEPVFETADTKMPLNQGDDSGDTDDQPNVKAASRDDCKIAKAGKPPLTFDELMSTPIDFSAYEIHDFYNKTKSTKYDTIEGIEDMVPLLWSPVKVSGGDLSSKRRSVALQVQGSRMEFYMENKENGRMILDSVQNGPLVWPTITEEDGTTRKKTYAKLSTSEKLQADCDCKATNIVLQGLLLDVYAIVNHHKVAKEIWDRFKLLMQGTKLSLQEKECKLYDEFDKFTFIKGETLFHYYWRFAQLINNMNVINMSMRPVQVNTKFLNSLPPEWSKFVMNVKLARDLHTTNYDQFYSYLEQHEIHANETRLIREHYQDTLAFVANYHQSPSQLNNYHSQYNPT